MWVQTVYHELAHYVFWTDAERKAETFTSRMVRGLKRSLRRARSSSHDRQGSKRRALRGRHLARIRTRRRRLRADYTANRQGLRQSRRRA
jgi:hypothetical protein